MDHVLPIALKRIGRLALALTIFTWGLTMAGVIYIGLVIRAVSGGY